MKNRVKRFYLLVFMMSLAPLIQAHSKGSHETEAVVDCEKIDSIQLRNGVLSNFVQLPLTLSQEDATEIEKRQYFGVSWGSIKVHSITFDGHELKQRTLIMGGRPEIENKVVFRENGTVEDSKLFFESSNPNERLIYSSVERKGLVYYSLPLRQGEVVISYRLYLPFVEEGDLDSYYSQPMCVRFDLIVQ